MSRTASHWGVYDVDADGSVRGMPEDPHPSPLVRGLPELVGSDLRVDRPHVREGWLRRRTREGRGAERFVPVGWDTALELVADELTRVRERHGNEGIYGGCYGWASAGRLHHAPSTLKRFLAGFGGYVDKVGNHSFGAALAVMPHVVGRSDIPNLTPTWPEVVEHTELVVMFGGAHLKNTAVDPGGALEHTGADWFARAHAAGVRFVNVSPSREDLTASVDPEWLPVRPGTDVALMLGLAHTLLEDGRADREFLARYCDGWESFERYLHGHDADWAAGITGIAAERIRDLARRMAAHRTLVTTSWSVQRAQHGEQPPWMTVALAAVLGGIGLPGQGFGLGFGSIRGNVVPRTEPVPRPTLPLGKNPVDIAIPVGRFADLLLHPGEELEYAGGRIPLPDVRLVYSAGGNPFHHNANLNRLLEGWRRLDTVIVHEQFWNPPAVFADIVLPATTTLERNDVLATEFAPEWRAMYRVRPPHAQARNDLDVFAELADRLGFGPDYHEGRDEMGWLRHLYDVAADRAREQGYEPPDFDGFWTTGRVTFPAPASPPVFSAFRADPVAHPLATPSGRIQITSPTVAGLGYDDQPGHPVWHEPGEWLGAAGPTALHLLSNQPAARLHSQLDPSSGSRATKVDGREPLRIARVDAEARGIADGDTVRVSNARGAFYAGARVTDDLVPGVLSISTGAWYDPAEPGTPGSPDKHGSPNVVTADSGSSRLGQAPVAQTVLVEVEKVIDAPPVTAFAGARV
ncbi:molybdopterin-dependent oxidoreductase [Actinomycetospora termitidis]|uniref:Molybdopterin-dependent oxidoreductase n=1 Tax=Actinomycetospora termitidis TaxID=3053470 RepID=A0ABT7MGT9_9PSEU|nr:molybdopterin-dependent oxidoreductase [Actinomycetospora sp. Odt1-22]MDL5158563.1 molybdopterin-dependent oxidoreductase [Actinomycetospora sp. Odt1-22]